MNAEQLLSHLAGLGVVVTVEGDRLRCSAPKGVLTPELRERLAAAKPEICALLREESARGAGAGAPAEIPRVAERGRYPLSLAQERVWALSQRDPDGAGQTLTLAYEVTGPLDTTALARSLHAVARRHEILRTTYELFDGRPAQRVASEATIALGQSDLRALPDDARAAEAARRVAAAADARFDLARGPLVRVELLRTGEQAYQLVFACHQIVFDAGGIDVLAAELCAHYDAFARGLTPQLPPLERQYGDYAAWQRTTALGGDALARLRSYWQAQLAGAPPSVALPGRRPPSDAEGFLSEREAVAVAPETAQALRALGQRARSTPFVVYFAALAAALHGYSGAQDLCVFTSVAGRNHPELRGLIGLFANWLVLRVRLAGDPTLEELLARARETTLGALAHQDLPFDHAIELLAPPDGAVRGSPFGVLCLYTDHAPAAAHAAGVTFRPIESARKWTRFDWQFAVEDDPRGTEISLRYRADLFDPAAIRAVLSDYVLLLSAWVEAPAQRLSELRARVFGASPLAAPAPGPASPRPRTRVAPRDELEASLVALWERVLGVEPIGVTDNFFALGGYSLQAIRLFDELEREHAVKLTLPEFMRAASVEKLAALVRRQRGDAAVPPQR